MADTLRHTQTESKPDFAYHALAASCAPCKMTEMRVNLAKIRGKRSLEAIAEKLDVSISTVQRWEKHSMNIPSMRLPDIARAYGCKLGDIFSEDEDTTSSPQAEIQHLFPRLGLKRQETVARFVREMVEDDARNSKKA